MMTNTANTAHRAGTRVTGAARDKLAADLKEKYENGASIRSLSEAIGRSYSFVHGLLNESGVQFRNQGGWRGAPVKNQAQ